MTTYTTPSPSSALPAPAYAARYSRAQLVRIPSGSRIEWQGRAGTVTHGNMPSEWVPDGSATVSVTFDYYGRGLTRYAEVFADEVTLLPVATVWEV